MVRKKVPEALEDLVSETIALGDTSRERKDIAEDIKDISHECAEENRSLQGYTHCTLDEIEELQEKIRRKKRRYR
jgi:hypothetical protein